eukprot:7385979-Prymnesium_polylepis.1
MSTANAWRWIPLKPTSPSPRVPHAWSAQTSATLTRFSMWESTAAASCRSSHCKRLALRDGLHVSVKQQPFLDAAEVRRLTNLVENASALYFPKRIVIDELLLLAS